MDQDGKYEWIGTLYTILRRNHQLVRMLSIAVTVTFFHCIDTPHITFFILNYISIIGYAERDKCKQLNYGRKKLESMKKLVEGERQLTYLSPQERNLET
jgi:hypothetical protein